MAGFRVRLAEPGDADALARMANVFDAEDMGAESLQPFTARGVARDMIGPDAVLKTFVADTGDRLAGFTNHLSTSIYRCDWRP
ncbi:MAG: hypothetical protein P1U65_07955 [Minwuia sp.]|nr:hypothetical protein [Minwuia sp.]